MSHSCIESDLQIHERLLDLLDEPTKTCSEPVVSSLVMRPLRWLWISQTISDNACIEGITDELHRIAIQERIQHQD